MRTKIIDMIAFCLLAIGGINWGLVGFFDWNLVSAIFGAGQTIGSTIIYGLVFVSTLWLIFSIIYNKGKLDLMACDCLVENNPTK